ncbi:MAG: acyltransferase [Pleurocapsa sp.]
MNILKQIKALFMKSNWKTSIFTTLLGWIPLLPGIGLRYLLYPLIFKQMGRSVRIAPDVRLKNGQNIAIGFGVVLHKGVELDFDADNELKIGDRVNLARDVGISCTEQNNKIELDNVVSLDRGVELRAHGGGEIYLGERTYIGPYTCISGYGKVAIGKDCLIASHCAIYAHNYNFSDPNKTIKEQGFVSKGITIEDDCWLGSGVKVVDGVTIGKGCIVAAGSVVMRDIPPYSIAAGFPAKVIAKRGASELNLV